jgi:hypothetical protein
MGGPTIIPSFFYSRNFRVLITGDIEKEADIAGRWHFPPVDVLKVAHHGSRTSTGETWLALVRPAAAVISVGTTGKVIHQRELIHRYGRNVVVGGGTVTFYQDEFMRAAYSFRFPHRTESLACVTMGE